MIDHATIGRLVPHAGAMCLLDRVLAWSPHTILCAAESHRSEDNPMRHGGRLGVVCGVEYASQAMALHGALCQGAMAQAALAPAELSRGELSRGDLSRGDLSRRAPSRSEMSRSGSTVSDAAALPNAESPAALPPHPAGAVPADAPAGVTPEIGFLASVRALTCHVDRLDDLPGTLEIAAERLHGEAGRVMYGFVLRHQSRVLLEGRAAVVIGGLLP